MKKNNIKYLEQNLEIGDYVQVKNNGENIKAIIVDKQFTGKEDRKYKYVVIDTDYNKKTYYADQLIKLSKTNDNYKNNVLKFKK